MANVKDLEPYAANLEGLIAVLEDFRKTMPIAVPSKVVGYQAEAFENVSQGDAIYSRTSDGKVGKAVANGTLDQATVAGFDRFVNIQPDRFAFKNVLPSTIVFTATEVFVLNV